MEDLSIDKTTKKESYEDYLVNKVGVDHKLLAQGKERVKNWTKENWDKYHNDMDCINKELVHAIQNNLSIKSDIVQNIIKKHFELVNIFWTPNKKSYIGLAQMYQEYSDFRVFYSNYHTDLVEFLTDAMFTFAQNSLK